MDATNEVAEVRQEPTSLGLKKQKKTRRKSTEERRVLFTEDVARMIGCSAATVERMRYEGRGPKWVRIGTRSIVYLEEAVLEWLRQEQQGGERE